MFVYKYIKHASAFPSTSGSINGRNKVKQSVRNLLKDGFTTEFEAQPHSEFDRTIRLEWTKTLANLFPYFQLKIWKLVVIDDGNFGCKQYTLFKLSKEIVVPILIESCLVLAKSKPRFIENVLVVRSVLLELLQQLDHRKFSVKFFSEDSLLSS